jgi:DNA-binding response OmpR family regulator
VRDVVIEHLPTRLRVVGGGTGVRTHSSRKASRRYPPGQVPRRAILYIGGDQECQIVLSRIVRRMDYTQLVVAGSGREGRLSAFARAPSLIVLDSQLPDCAAQDLMVYFGRAALRATVPIAVVSGDDEERSRFIRAGAAAWMTKPLRIDDVERSVSRLLDLFSPS